MWSRRGENVHVGARTRMCLDAEYQSAASESGTQRVRTSQHFGAKAVSVSFKKNLLQKQIFQHNPSNFGESTMVNTFEGPMFSSILAGDEPDGKIACFADDVPTVRFCRAPAANMRPAHRLKTFKLAYDAVQTVHVHNSVNE